MHRDREKGGGKVVWRWSKREIIPIAAYKTKLTVSHFRSESHHG